LNSSKASHPKIEVIDGSAADYAVSLPWICENYRDTVMAMPFMREWISQAILEHEDFDELSMDF